MSISFAFGRQCKRSFLVEYGLNFPVLMFYISGPKPGVGSDVHWPRWVRSGAVGYHPQSRILHNTRQTGPQDRRLQLKLWVSLLHGENSVYLHKFTRF